MNILKNKRQMMFKTFLSSMLCAIINVGCASYAYDTSKKTIDSTHERSHFYPARTGSNAGIVESNEFLKIADRNIPVIVHAHGCSGIWAHDVETQMVYSDEFKFHVVLVDFMRREGVKPSCGMIASNTGYAETINPARQEARRMEIDSQVSWLKQNGFKYIFVSGRSEGGKVVQHIKSNVNGVIVHNMDCKSREFWKPNKNNKYFFMYSTVDPWITGNGNYSTVACSNSFNREQVTELVNTTIMSHSPFTDPTWKPSLYKFIVDNTK